MKITECPRDAIQGIKNFIPTDLKIKYINSLLSVGFDTIDFGSFVSPKVVPQMKDVKDVVNGMSLTDTNTKLLGIVGNKRGAQELLDLGVVDTIGYPHSMSETFLKLNLNSNIDKSLYRLEEIMDLNDIYGKNVLVYMSMGFGNPYGDGWDIDMLLNHIDTLYDMEVKNINISDTIGIATPDIISDVFKNVFENYPNIEFGLHLHTHKDNWLDKVNAAYDVGVKKFDSVIGGIGGCPMTGYELVGNLNTANLIDFLIDKNEATAIDKTQLNKSIELSKEIYSYKSQ